MKITRMILQGGLLAALALPAAAFAQGYTINQRKENQQDRIANGVQSGRLTARETANWKAKSRR